MLSKIEERNNMSMSVSISEEVMKKNEKHILPTQILMTNTTRHIVIWMYLKIEEEEEKNRFEVILSTHIKSRLYYITHEIWLKHIK